VDLEKKNIVEFLNENNIKWFPIHLTYKDKMDKGIPVIQYGEQKKEKILDEINHSLYKNYKGTYYPLSTDFTKLSDDIILKRQKLLKTEKYGHLFNAIAIDTNEVYHIDYDIPIEELRRIAVDAELINSLEMNVIEDIRKSRGDNTLPDVEITKLPFYQSTTKSYGFHLMLKPTKKLQKIEQKMFKRLTNDVEILSNGWSWAGLDIDVYNPECLNTPVDFEVLQNKFNKPVNKIVKSNMNEYSSSVEMIECLCRLIDEKHIKSYDPWYKLILSLKSYSLEHPDDEDAILKIADDMSQGYNTSISSYTTDGVDKVWNTDVKGITIGTIHYYAKLSNPEEYNNIMKQYSKKKLDVNMLSLKTDTEFGKVFNELKGNEYMYNPKAKLLYKFNGVYWSADYGEKTLYCDIRDTIAPMYQSAIDEYVGVENASIDEFKNKQEEQEEPEEEEEEAEEEKEEEEEVEDIDEDETVKIARLKAKMKIKAKELKSKAKELKAKEQARAKAKKQMEKELNKMVKNMDDELKRYTKICDDLKTEPFIRRIVNDVLSRRSMNTIDFDKQPWLFAFNNEIYDLRTGLKIDPEPSQLITTTTGYDKIDTTKEDIDELTNVIEKIFPDENERELYMMVLAYGLIGIAIEKLVCLTGSGSNGKGLLNDLMIKLCGSSKYSYVGSSTTLTQEIKDGANPAVALMDNKRFVLFQEANEGQALQGGTVKKLSGGGTINARNLFSDKTDTKLLAMIVLEFNKRPRFNCSVDNALVRRLCVINMRSMFVPSVDIHKYEGMENIYPSNPTYKTEEWQDRFRFALFELIVPYCKLIYDQTQMNSSFSLDNYIARCPDVVETTKEYIASNDVLNEFMNEEMVYDTNSAITIKGMFKAFKNSEGFLSMDRKQKEGWDKEALFRETISKHPMFYKNYKETLYLNVKANEKYAIPLGATKNARNVILNWRLKTADEKDDEPQNEIVDDIKEA
jgi:phage/plasmid-associated DNA primase